MTGDASSGSPRESSTAPEPRPDGGESPAEAADGEAAAIPPETPALARWLAYATRALQASLVGLAGYLLVSSADSSVFNVALPLAVALVPDAIHRATGWRMNPVLSLWIAAAAVLHATGSLGLYGSVPGYDWIAHAVSGALVAGVGYALVRGIGEGREDVAIPEHLRFVFVFVFTVAVGATWEIGEFVLMGAAELVGGDPLLTQYGLVDVVGDLVFDAAGAVIVALWATRYFAGVRAALGNLVGNPGPDDRSGRQ